MKILLSILACLSVSSQAFAISCHGTEPFWGAEITDKEVVLDYPGDEKVPELLVDEVGAAAGYVSDYIKVYKNQGNPVAVVLGNKCSDGMSDFTYPQEVMIFNGSTTLYGCCGEGVME